MEIFKRYDLLWERAQAHLQWGIALRESGADAAAHQQFDAALDLYRRHGAGARWIELIDGERRGCGPAAAKPSSARGHAHVEIAQGIFRDDGDYWTVSLNGSLMRLRSTKGLHYIACLLAHPGEKFGPLQLARMAHGDARHKASRNGRERSADERSAERSRVMVTKSIKAAVGKIRAGNSALGRHLAVSIRTGHACVYEPDPEHPISWRVGD